eukprot:3403326-Ditylum_brightwellii.AAC.1
MSKTTRSRHSKKGGMMLELNQANRPSHSGKHQQGADDNSFGCLSMPRIVDMQQLYKSICTLGTI